MYFYELHEGDDELFGSLLLAHDAEYDEQEFFDLVVEARAAVIGHFNEDSLIEAVAAELGRKHGFVPIEANLRAAVSVSTEEGETATAPVDELGAPPLPTEEEDFRSMLIETESEDRPYRN